MFSIEYLGNYLIFVGVLLMLIEVSVFGFALLIFLFIGLASLTTGLLMNIGFINESIENGLYFSMGLTILYTIVLWKLFKKNEKVDLKEIIEDDFAKVDFILSEDVSSVDSDVFYEYSGIKWKLKSEGLIKKGSRVRVVKKEVGVFWIEPVD